MISRPRTAAAAFAFTELHTQSFGSENDEDGARDMAHGFEVINNSGHGSGESRQEKRGHSTLLRCSLH